MSTEFRVTEDKGSITHTGEVTGSDVLTVDSTAISNKAVVTGASGQEVLVNDSGTLKKVDAGDFLSAGGGVSHLGSFNANDATFPASNPASAFSRNAHPILTFDDSTAENVIFHSVLSEDYSGGDVTFNIDWAAETATSGGVTWGIEIERLNAGGHDIDSDSFDTQQTGNSTTAGTSGVITRTSITMTNAECDGWAAGDAFRIRLQRVTGDGGDTMTNDAQVLRVSMDQ